MAGQVQGEGLALLGIMRPGENPRDASDESNIWIKYRCRDNWKIGYRI